MPLINVLFIRYANHSRRNCTYLAVYDLKIRICNAQTIPAMALDPVSCATRGRCSGPRPPAAFGQLSDPPVPPVPPVPPGPSVAPGASLPPYPLP